MVSLNGTAQVEAARERGNEAVGVIDDGKQYLAVPHETVGALSDVCAAAPGVDHPLDPTAIGQVGPCLFRLCSARHSVGAFCRNQAILTIPEVGPQAVAGLVTVEIVEECFSGLGEVKIAGVGAGSQVERKLGESGQT